MHKIRTVSLTDELDAAIEKARGHIPRSLWYRIALENQLRMPLPAPSEIEPLPEPPEPTPNLGRPERAPEKRQRKRTVADLASSRQARLNKAKGL